MEIQFYGAAREVTGSCHIVHVNGRTIVLDCGLFQGRRADALEFTAAEGRFDDVARIHRALGGAGTDDGVQLVDEKDHGLGAADFVHHRLDALLELASIFGARNHQCQVQRDDALIAQNLRHVARGDFLREALDDGRLAHTSLTDEDGIVLRATAKDLDDTFDLAASPDDRVHVALARKFREVTPECTKRRCLSVLLPAAGLRCLLRRILLALGRGEVWIEFLQDFVPCAFDIHLEILQYARSHALAFAEKAEQDVLGADVAVIQRLRLLAGERQHFLHPRGIWDVSDHFLVGSAADLLFDFHTDGLEIQPHFLQDIDCNTLAEFDQTQEEVLGAHIVVVEPIGFLPGKCQHLLRARREVIHHNSDKLSPYRRQQCSAFRESHSAATGIIKILVCGYRLRKVRHHDAKKFFQVRQRRQSGALASGSENCKNTLMKFLPLLASLLLFGATPSRSEVSPIHMDIEQTSKTEPKGKAPAKGPPPSEKVQTRSLAVKLSNNSTESFDNLIVKYWFFGHAMTERESTPMKDGSGERKASVGPRGRVTVDIPSFSSTYVEAHSEGSGKGAAKKVPASGDKIMGYAVQVLNGEKVMAENYSELSYKAKLGQAPKAKEAPKTK